MVALVLGVDDLVVVEHGELNGSGAHVDAQMQVATSVLGVEDRAFGGVGGGGDCGLGGGGLASGGRLPCRVLGIGNCLGTSSAAAVAAFCAASTTAGAASRAAATIRS